MINLGGRVKDKITGFEGIAIAKIIYLNGCISYEVRAQELKDGKMLDTVWIDEQQLTEKSRAVAGGPGSIPPKSNKLHD
mgnify:CR=1 FL=1